MWSALILLAAIQSAPVTECGRIRRAWDDKTAGGPYRALQFEFVHNAEFALLYDAALASAPSAEDMTGAVVCVVGEIVADEKKVMRATSGGAVTIKQIRPYSADEAVALFAAEQAYFDGLGPKPELDLNRLSGEHRAFFEAALKARVARSKRDDERAVALEKETSHRETIDALMDGVNHIGDVFRADLADQDRRAAERAGRRAPIEEPLPLVPRQSDYSRPTRTRIDAVSSDGAVLRLRDGTAWRVEARDQARTSRWSASQRISVVRRAGNEAVLINTKGDTVTAVRVD